MKAKKKLSKLPEGRSDYVVEHIDGGKTQCVYFADRADARKDAKESTAERVRVFRIKYVLVSDKKSAK